MGRPVGEQIFNGFNEYLQQFYTLTRSVKNHFEQGNWNEIQQISRQRLAVYKDKVAQTSEEIKESMGDHTFDRKNWKYLKATYKDLVSNHPAYEIAESFFNSVCRKIHPNLAVANEMMFVLPSDNELTTDQEEKIYRRYGSSKSSDEVIRRILADYSFNVPYYNLEEDIQFINRTVHNQILAARAPDRNTCVEVLRPVFFRNKGAYLIGRVITGNEVLPFVLPILQQEGKLFVDALIFDPNDVSILFGFARSYFFVDALVPSEVVAFLKSIMPRKRIGELYNAIGFNKHGKTEEYRDFINHLDASDDQFIVAPGVKGMVMTVFTLPSYPIVFKLIKDTFDPPKNVTHSEVKDKYKLVSQHDRVGRMADTHEYEYFVFNRKRFSSELIQELKKVANSVVEVQEDQIVIKHLYTERRMTPLNLFLKEATEEDCREAVNEYGKAIKDLAKVNIFPGDLFTKNFGVTRHNRVIFYDYDEIMFITDCNFRLIPEPETFEQIYSSRPWYTVGPNDIFPEEFRQFLLPRGPLLNYFSEVHGDLYTTDFWVDMQEKHKKGEVMDVFPYIQTRRFRD